MKHLLTISIFVIISTLTSKAQNIPNGDFEKGYNLVDSTIPNWTNFGSFTIGLNDSVLTDGPLFLLSSQANNGNYALELRSYFNVTQNLANEYKFGCDSQNISLFQTPIIYLTSKPNSLSFYYKIPLAPINNFVDTTQCNVTILNTDFEEIGSGNTKMWLKSATYLLQSLSIQYLPASSIMIGDSIPAYARIYFNQRIKTDTPHVGHRILIDDLNLNFSPSTFSEKNKKIKLTLSPNPISDEFYIKNYTILNDASLNIFNFIGQSVYSKKINKNENLNFNIAFLPKGLYFIRLKDGDEIYQTKLLKE